MKRRTTCGFPLFSLLLAAFAILLLTSSSFTFFSGARRGAAPPPSPFELSLAWQEENQDSLLITNVGIIGQNPNLGVGEGYWPSGTTNLYIFGNGLWIGGIADVDDDGDVDTVTVLAYEPSQGATEHREGRVGQNPSDPLTRVFDSRIQADLDEWPQEFSDPGGDPVVLSQQDLVTIYNDLAGTPFGMNALGIQVNQRSMDFSGKVAGTSVHATYFVWTVVNRSDSLADGPYTIEDIYLGFCADIDIGNTATDEMTSFVPLVVEDGDTTILNSALAWDRNFSENFWQGEVGMIGFMFDEQMVPDAEVNFTYMSNAGTFRPDPAPGDDLVQYNILACLDGQCEEHNYAEDIRFVLSIGPVDLAPGQVQRYRGVMFFTDPFGDPTSLEFTGDPARVDPYQPGMANFIQVAKEVKEGMRTGAFPSPFTIFRTSIHETTSDTLGPYTIHAGVTDSVGVKEVSLNYSTDGGTTFTPIAMEPSAILNYSGDIPGQPSVTTVHYYVEAIDSADVVLTDPANAPDSTYSFVVEYTSGIETDDPAGPVVPHVVSLGQNYPNPFNPTTVITFAIPEGEGDRQHALLEIFDTRGRLVRTLVNGSLEPGNFRISWDGRTNSGETAGSGIYIYRLSVDETTLSKKMVLLK